MTFSGSDAFDKVKSGWWKMIGMSLGADATKMCSWEKTASIWDRALLAPCLELGAGDLSERHKLNELKGDVQFEFRWKLW
jgi:hypothetical protein